MFCRVSVTVMLKQLVYRISGTLGVTDSVTVLILVEDTEAGFVCTAKEKMIFYVSYAVFQPYNC